MLTVDITISRTIIGEKWGITTVVTNWCHVMYEPKVPQTLKVSHERGCIGGNCNTSATKNGHKKQEIRQVKTIIIILVVLRRGSIGV